MLCLRTLVVLDICCQWLYCNTALLQASKLPNISVFLSHRVQTLLVLYAALGFSCSTRCPLPRKHQLQLSPPPRLGGSLGSSQSSIGFGYRSDFPHSTNYTPFHGSFPHGSFRILLSAFCILPTPAPIRYDITQWLCPRKNSWAQFAVSLSPRLTLHILMAGVTSWLTRSR